MLAGTKLSLFGPTQLTLQQQCGMMLFGISMSTTLYDTAMRTDDDDDNHEKEISRKH